VRRGLATCVEDIVPPLHALTCVNSLARILAGAMFFGVDRRG
jgi:hypothetical protein